jgi:serine/threonine protein phosphatase PrpC
MVAAGLVSEADAMALPGAHVVTGWLGADSPGAPPHVVTFTPSGPGVLLLCSDGLWNYRPEAGGLARLALPEALSDPLGAAAELVRFAVRGQHHGGPGPVPAHGTPTRGEARRRALISPWTSPASPASG